MHEIKVTAVVRSAVMHPPMQSPTLLATTRLDSEFSHLYFMFDLILCLIPPRIRDSVVTYSLNSFVAYFQRSYSSS